MKNITVTRRSAMLAGGGAVAAGLVVPLPIRVHPDHVLLDAEQSILSLTCYWNTRATPLTSEESSVVCDRICGLEEHIASMPAFTVEGILAKLRRAEVGLQELAGPEDGSLDWTNLRQLRSAMADIARLMGRVA